ncbi:MAG: hypothetical protein KDD42_05695 [Bdellovibrionales bacterium]|nr:hypothetical protein [Bdellovibrionales bacterium]
MSLVSVRNILAPFGNKVHLTTIILCGIVFVVLRLSGGGIDVQSDSELDLPNDVQEYAPLKTERHKGRSANQHESSSREDLLGEMIGQEPTPAPRRQKQQPEARPLDDIERSLGLR